VDLHSAKGSGAETLWQDTSSACRLQLPLQDTICALSLLSIPCKRIVVLCRMTVAEPVDLTLHGAQSGDKEEGPFVIVNVGLLRGWIGPEDILLIVHP